MHPLMQCDVVLVWVEQEEPNKDQSKSFAFSSSIELVSVSSVVGLQVKA